MNKADNFCMFLFDLVLIRTSNRNKQMKEVQLASDLVCRLKRIAAVFYRFQRFRKMKYSSFEVVLSYILKGSFKKQTNK